ncbi:MAG: hypothetical protein NC328_08210 [Muribaculum sp.]|nr:hypothetical protein [Muribaculum sp.]
MQTIKKLMVSAVAMATIAIGFAAEPANLRVIKKAGVKKVPAATSQIIKDTPQGVMLTDMLWSSRSAAPDATGKNVQWSEVEDLVPSIVKNGNKMYIYNPISSLSSIATAWIEGEISADGRSVTFNTPQAYLVNGTNNGQQQILYATRLNAEGKLDTSNLKFTLSIDEEGNMAQTDGGVLALTNLDGGFYGYAEGNVAINKITDELVALPSDAVISEYILNYSTQAGATRQSAKIAVAGNDYYFSDPVRAENVWFKGTREGNTITCAYGQYMGTQSGHPLYLTTAKVSYNTVIDPYFGIPQQVAEYTLYKDQPVVFTIDANGNISTDQMIFMNNSRKNVGTAYAAYDKPNYEPWTRQLVNPTAPELSSYFDLSEYAAYGLGGCSIVFNLKPNGANGEFIPQEDLYYELTIDGKPYEIYGTSKIRTIHHLPILLFWLLYRCQALPIRSRFPISRNTV